MPRFRNLVVNTSALADGSVTAAKIADGAVTTPKLDALAVTEAKVALAAITEGKLADLAVGTAKIQAAAITAAQIADAAISTAKIDNAAINKAKIGNAQVTNAKISTLAASKITAGTITAATITMGSGGLIQLSSGEIRSSTGSTYVALSGNQSDRVSFHLGGQLAADMQITSGRMRLRNYRAGDGWQLVDGHNLVYEFNNGFDCPTFVFTGGGTSLGPGFAFRNDPSTGLFRFGGGVIGFTSEGDFCGDIRSGGWRIRSHPTTGAGANAVIRSSDGLLMRSTSSRRFKTALRPWDGRASVLDLVPTLFRSTLEHDDRRRLRLGLVAEDVAERFPLAAVHDDDGRPEAIDWHVITAGLLAEVRDLAGRVAALE